MIPDYQTLMRPVLECATGGEVRIGDAVEQIANKLGLTAEERTLLLPSGKQTRFANRVNWAKSYLKQAGLVENTRRGYYALTARGRTALTDVARTIDNAYLEQFEQFQHFRGRTREAQAQVGAGVKISDAASTPDEVLREAHKGIEDALAVDLLDRVRCAAPAFFEKLIVDLLVAMGYGGTAEDAGRALGKSGDDGIDGVIDQDTLGVDQIYLQAKRYAEGNHVGSGSIRDFFGALNLKRAHKGIFVTTSAFSPSAVQTARHLGSRIVLIDGIQLSRLMIRYNIGCREEEVLRLKKIDEDFFEE